MNVYSFFAIVLAGLLGQNSCSGGHAVLNPFPFGTIGCLVSEDVCSSGEVCTNDLLFGSCQNIFTRALSGEIRFHLERGEVTRLSRVIRKLIRAGFTWKDAFTQCSLQNTLLEYSRGKRTFDLSRCKEALGVTSSDITQEMNREIADVLLDLLEKGELDLDDIDALISEEHPNGYLNSNKRDEIVQVHKYFDKSSGQIKRDPFSFDESSYNPSPKTLYNSPSSAYDDSSRNAEFMKQYLSETQPQEVQQQAEYSNVDQNDFPYFSVAGRSDNSKINPLTSYVSTGVDVDNESSNSSPNVMMDQPLLQEPVESPNDGLTNSGEPQEDLSSLPSEGNPLVNNKVSEKDEITLAMLLDGTLQPSDLDSKQQERMQLFVGKLIKVLAQTPETDYPIKEEELQELQAPEQAEEPAPVDTVTSEVQKQNELTNDELLANDDNEEVEKKSSHLVLPPAVAAPLDNGTPDDEDIDTAKSIDSHTVFMVLNKQLDLSAGFVFIHNLSKSLGIEDGVLKAFEVMPNKMIEITVDTRNSEGLDAEAIANKAVNAKDEIEKTTGIQVLTAGVGRYGHGVEIKQNNKYFVITFILVASIAGVVVAVVGIYLYKRHNHSRDKLAQMTANPDGNEASKDYQDLCRQRMQGKSSEKPEPLHAASRIGSTSESQVRSPSSRSSTSSWSEEPAATNMDISTGHIVLSYMEDHLKNQDRLDKEWEAVCNYVADPASTKVATDQSNMRKNRFADILPYDHSRVVLSSHVNVSNSDYINASFITDHDPRNPAYICTQGPVPHTVADFWQMIWEQGSVVIVMLSKLTENGTSLCHRYWPEEGSDLYHIYEVHLVSEHIWCDDYLVRSFYLKNLQTNETRTVTQFHFLTWPQLSVPASIKTLLDFRRKVNKSFRGRSCPIVVHCSDGCGRSGTYCLVDMVLNKMAKGAKEIDMAATLEHIRDQRMATVKTKEQFQFSLAAVAEEVHAILKALPQ